MKNLWGGRFKDNVNNLMKSFNDSFATDKRLWKQDITASIAHVTMLGSCNIIPEATSQKIVQALTELQEEIKEDPNKLQGDYEDIHTFVEAQMIEELGDDGKKMHTGRSRNDQVAVDMKLYVKDSLSDLKPEIEKMITAFQNKGQSIEALMPAYTHLQRAQIIPFSYYLDAYCQMFARDLIKIDHTLQVLDENPLGAGALAGTTHPINRELTTQLLGFKSVQKNTLDAVSNRDFVLDGIQTMVNIMVHLSRFAEDMIIYASQEFNFIELPDTYSTGSSMMPQKKNPDALELVRGKAGKVIGLMTSMYTIMKGLPLTYNKDMQEDKEIYFEVYDTTLMAIQIITGFVTDVKVNEDLLNQTVNKGYLNATEMADYLVKKGLPFRQAHEIVGHAVLYAIEHDKQLHDLSLEELQNFEPIIDQDIFQYLDPKEILKQGSKKEMLK